MQIASLKEIHYFWQKKIWLSWLILQTSKTIYVSSEQRKQLNETVCSNGRTHKIIEKSKPFVYEGLRSEKHRFKSLVRYLSCLNLCSIVSRMCQRRALNISNLCKPSGFCSRLEMCLPLLGLKSKRPTKRFRSTRLYIRHMQTYGSFS